MTIICVFFKMQTGSYLHRGVMHFITDNARERRFISIWGSLFSELTNIADFLILIFMGEVTNNACQLINGDSSVLDKEFMFTLILKLNRS